MAAQKGARVSSAHEPVGLARRLGALFYDALLVMALWLLASLLVVILRGGAAVPPGTWWYQALMLTLAAGFFVWFWSHGGQTLGMRAWRIRLHGRGYGPVTWWQASLRLAAACATLGMGLLWTAFDAERLAPYDRWTRTRVLRSA